MEQTARAAVAPCDIGWADTLMVGVWRLRRATPMVSPYRSAASADTSRCKRAALKPWRWMAKSGCGGQREGLLIAPRSLVRDRDALSAQRKTFNRPDVARAALSAAEWVLSRRFAVARIAAAITRSGVNGAQVSFMALASIAADGGGVRKVESNNEATS